MIDTAVELHDLQGNRYRVTESYAAGVVATINFVKTLMSEGDCSSIERARRCIGRDCDRKNKCPQIKARIDMLELSRSPDHDYERVDYLTGSYSVLPFGQTSYWYRDQDFINGLLWCADSLNVSVSQELPGYVWNSVRGRVPIINRPDQVIDKLITLSAVQRDISDNVLYRANDAVERFMEKEVMA